MIFDIGNANQALRAGSQRRRRRRGIKVIAIAIAIAIDSLIDSRVVDFAEEGWRGM